MNRVLSISFFLLLMVLGSVQAGISATAKEQNKAATAMPSKRQLMKLLQDARMKAFLDLLAHGEGTSYHEEVKIPRDQYRITFCNDGKIESFKDHPRKKCCNKVGDRIICATAAGRYMFLQKTWDWIQEKLDLHDFSPLNQDLAALYLLNISGATAEILNNNIQQAIAKSSRFWAPMPGNNYNQPQTKLDELLALYRKRLIFYQNCNEIPQKKGRL